MASTRGTKTSAQKIAERDAKIRELEEKIARLEADKGRTPEGTAATVLKGLGGMFPGLDRIIEGLGKSEAFQERLIALDEELESRLKGEPLARMEVRGGVSSIPSRPRGRPMGRRPAERRRAPVAEPEVPAVEEPPADVFDEGAYLKVVAELPGVEEKDIKTDLTESLLNIFVDTLAHRYRKGIALPYAPKGKMERLYRNGVLELTLWKE